MKRFIVRVDSVGFNTKNAKGRALWEYCKDKYEHVLLNDECDSKVMLDDIRGKIRELNEKFPTLRQHIVMTEENARFGAFCDYTARWEDKNNTTAFVMRAYDVKGVMTGGCLSMEDKIKKVEGLASDSEVAI